MDFCAVHVGFHASDLDPERFDSVLQFLDRHRVEILLGELDQRIAGLAREEVFQVHGPGR